MCNNRSVVAQDRRLRLAPRLCSIVYRRGYWFLVLPKTTRSYECLLSFKRKEGTKEEAPTTRNRFGLRSIGQLRQVHIERNDGDGDLPALEHVGVQFADETGGELSGSRDRLLGFVRELDANEVGHGIEIIFSRFINYTKISVFIHLFVRDDAIHFPPFQVIAIIVLHAENELAVSLFPRHCYSLNLEIA